MEEQNLKFNFSFTDEFGQTIKFERELTNANLIDYTSFDLQLEQFKLFLLSQGYHNEQVDRIRLIEE